MSTPEVLAGIDLLLQLIDRLSAASALLKAAHAEGRGLNTEELTQLRNQYDGVLSDLDAEISKKK